MAVREIDETIAGRAGFDTANLRPQSTGLPFVVFISQKGGARHDVRIKLSRGPQVRPSRLITVAVRPVPRVVQGHVSGPEFELVRRWIEWNEPVLVGYRNGAIEYTEDVLSALRPITGKPAE